jgi:hypothetical protein
LLTADTILDFVNSAIESAEATDDDEQTADYTAKGTFTSHDTSIQSSIAEAPDISAFQPVISSKPAAAASQQTKSEEAPTNDEKKRKKKKKSSEDDQQQNFELPSHLIPLESDTPAQKLKKARAAKSLKSKFRSKQKEIEATKKANDWKSFATKSKKVKVGDSIFSTEEGVNARVGVVSGGGVRGMTEAERERKRHKFA